MPRAKAKKADDPMSHLVLEDGEEVLASDDKDDGSVVVVTSGGRKWSLTADGAELTMGPPLPVDEEPAEEVEEPEPPTQDEVDAAARELHEPIEMTAPKPEPPLTKAEQAKIDEEAKAAHDAPAPEAEADSGAEGGDAG